MANNPVIRWFESNVVTILLALLLALTVWIIATQNVDPIELAEFSDPIPIEMGGLGSNLVITNTPDSTVTVEVRASRSTVQSLTLDNFSATADLTNLGPGTHQVPVQVDVLNAQAIKIRDSVTPPYITVVIEQITQREVPIQLAKQGDLQATFKIDSETVAPETVVIRGPQSRVQLVSEVQASVSIAGMRETYDGDVSLVALDSNGVPVSGLTITPGTAHVTIAVSQEAGVREVAVNVDTSNFKAAQDYTISRISWDPLIVTVRGDPNVIRELRFIEAQAVNLDNLTQDETITLLLEPPDGVTLEGSQTVTVTVYVEAQSGFNALEIPVQVIGLGEGLQSTLVPDTVGIFVSGPKPVLDNPQFSVVVTVDVTDLGVGTYQLAPDVQLAGGDIPDTDLSQVTIESVVPTVIEVDIEEATPTPQP